MKNMLQLPPILISILGLSITVEQAEINNSGEFIIVNCNHLLTPNCNQSCPPKNKKI